MCRLVEDGSQSGSCCLFVETENEVHGEECCKLAWLGARRLLARCGCSNFDRLEELEQLGTFACGYGEGSQKGGIQGDVRDRNGAPNTPVEKEENRSIPRTIRTELALSREIWRTRRALKRERHLDQIKESAEMGRAPKKTQSKHFNWKSIAKDENPESILTKYFRDF